MSKIRLLNIHDLYEYYLGFDLRYKEKSIERNKGH